MRPKIGQECKYKNMTGVVYAIYPGKKGVSVVCQVKDKIGVHFAALWEECEHNAVH